MKKGTFFFLFLSGSKIGSVEKQADTALEHMQLNGPVKAHDSHTHEDSGLYKRKKEKEKETDSFLFFTASNLSPSCQLDMALWSSLRHFRKPLSMFDVLGLGLIVFHPDST